MFKSFRVFTLKTSPGDTIVNRTRLDFKWLHTKLCEEYPYQHFAPVDKGELSKKIIEDFFDGLVNRLGLQNSRYLVYFLTADDAKFQERKKAEEEGMLNAIFSKFKKSPITLEELKVNSNEKSKVFEWFIRV